MLLHRYSDINYVLSLPIDIGTELITEAFKAEQDDRLFRQWTAQLPIMAFAGKAVGFEEYKESVTGSNVDLRPTEVILQEIETIEKAFT